MNDAPTEAACGAPNSAGSASGLRSRPCSAAPDRPNVAPIRIASSVRGRRMSRTMMPSAPWPSNRPASAWRGEMLAGPLISEMTASTSDQRREREDQAQGRCGGSKSMLLSPAISYRVASGTPIQTAVMPAKAGIQ